MGLFVMVGWVGWVMVWVGGVGCGVVGLGVESWWGDVGCGNGGSSRLGWVGKSMVG